MPSSPLVIEEDEMEGSDTKTDSEEDMVTTEVDVNTSENVSTEVVNEEFEIVKKEQDHTEHRLVLKMNTVDKSAKTGENIVEVNTSEKASLKREEEELEKVEKEKDQTEHRLVIKVDAVDKSAKTMLLSVPLETIRKRRSQKAKVDCFEDVLNYV